VAWAAPGIAAGAGLASLVVGAKAVFAFAPLAARVALPSAIAAAARPTESRQPCPQPHSTKNRICATPAVSSSPWTAPRKPLHSAVERDSRDAGARASMTSTWATPAHWSLKRATSARSWRSPERNSSGSWPGRTSATTPASAAVPLPFRCAAGPEVVAGSGGHAVPASRCSSRDAAQMKRPSNHASGLAR